MKYFYKKHFHICRQVNPAKGKIDPLRITVLVKVTYLLAENVKNAGMDPLLTFFACP